MRTRIEVQPDPAFERTYTARTMVTLFLSYSHADSRFVKPIVKQLHAAGVSVWFDDADIAPGEDLLDRISTGIHESKYFAVVLSAKALESGWVSRELRVALSREIEANRRIVIPILREHVEIPPFLEFRSYIDMTNPRRKRNGIQELLTILQGKESVVPPPKRQTKDSYNVLVLGRTGAGKSTLINHVFEADVREVGVGAPVTKPGFYPVEVSLGGVPFAFFDSMGVQTAGVREWRHLVQDEIARRSVDTAPQEWFHTILYCIQAGGDRIEPFDWSTITYFLDGQYSVIVVLTKADLADLDSLAVLEREIEQRFEGRVSSVAVASRGATIRSGVTEPFGIETLKRVVLTTFVHSLTLRLPGRCISRIVSEIEQWRLEREAIINKEAKRIYNLELMRQLNADSKDLVKRLSARKGLITWVVESELRAAFALYDKLATILARKRVAVTVSLSGGAPYRESSHPMAEMVFFLLGGLVTFGIHFLNARSASASYLNKRLSEFVIELKAEIEDSSDAVSYAVKECIDSVIRETA